MLPSSSKEGKAARTGPKKGANPAKKGKQEPVIAERSEEEDDGEEEEEEDEEMGSEGEEEEGSDSQDEMGSDMQQAVDDAVSQTMAVLGSLPSPADVEDAFAEIKSQVHVLLYTASIGKQFGKCLELETGGPFPEQSHSNLVDLFHRCTIHQHSVFKDNEWTIGSRRDACGASTSLLIRFDDDETSMMHLTFTWYWQPEEGYGFREEFSLARDENEDENDDDDEVEADDEHSCSSADNTITIMEGVRTSAGISQVDINLQALENIEQELRSGLSLQTLLRFIVLCTRTESPKIQGKLSSITDGYNADEDTEEFSKYLNSFTVAGGNKMPTNKGKKQGKRPEKGKFREEKKTKKQKT
jgi:hypothetical protein